MRHHSHAAAPGSMLLPLEAAGSRNMLLLMQLRWLAVVGQLGTILIVKFGMGVQLPIVPMIGVIAGLALLNIVTAIVLRRDRSIANYELFLALLVDFVALTVQLYLSGGATNPFAPIGILQVVLGAMLLEAWSSWVLAALHSCAFALLALMHRPLHLPGYLASSLSPAQILGSWINFSLVAVLLVLFVTRISRNLRRRDAHLAQMRQQAAEEDHIVRMGLLASGAAHELGTPLASLSVILGDWKQEPALAADPRLVGEIAEMRAAVRRCKDIVSGILYASGEVPGEAPERMTIRHFLAAISESWTAQHPCALDFEDRLGGDIEIIADRTLAQIIGNVLDNAAEAGATRVSVEAEARDGLFRLTISDDGPGFPPDMLETVGKPYQSSKERRGAGLGLFLAVNVMRKLGGAVSVRNGEWGGAQVALAIPLSALAFEAIDG